MAASAAQRDADRVTRQEALAAQQREQEAYRAQREAERAARRAKMRMGGVGNRKPSRTRPAQSVGHPDNRRGIRNPTRAIGRLSGAPPVRSDVKIVQSASNPESDPCNRQGISEKSDLEPRLHGSRPR